jgi:hypothetical protein
MRDDDDLLSMLRIVRDADAASEPLDSQGVARQLGWAGERTAGVLADARASLLIWGVRVGGRPSPCYADLEITVQGRRLLRDSETIGTTAANDE